MVTDAHPTIPLDIMVLAKHVTHVKEIREKVTKEKIRRTLQLKRDLQHKIEEFDLGPESLVLVKNSAIEISVNRKMKPRYLRPIIVVRKSQGGTYILAELDSLVWQNKVAAFRVLPYLSKRKLSFNSEVKDLLDVLEESLLELIAELDREVHIEGSMTKLLDWE